MRRRGGLEVDQPALLAALAGLAAHLAAEPLMRRGGARHLDTTPFERHSTLLVSALGLGSLVLSASLRLLAIPLPLPPGGAAPVLAALVLAGAALRYWSMAVLGERFTRTLRVARGQQVARTGPYRWIRHPGYLANLLAFGAGTCVVADSGLVGTVVTGALLLAYHHRIRSEEEMLEQHLGDAYREYRRDTWRLLPWLY